MGAPPCSIIIGKWFSQNERGLKMGIWNTSHNIGGGLIAPLATLALLIFGSNNFQSIFFVPAAVCILISIFVFFIGADTPESVGLPPIDEYRNDYAEVKVDTDATSLSTKEIVLKYVIINMFGTYA